MQGLRVHRQVPAVLGLDVPRLRGRSRLKRKSPAGAGNSVRGGKEVTMEKIARNAARRNGNFSEVDHAPR